MAIDESDLVIIAANKHLFCVQLKNYRMAAIEDVDLANKTITVKSIGQGIEKIPADELMDTGTGIFVFIEEGK